MKKIWNKTSKLFMGALALVLTFVFTYSMVDATPNTITIKEADYTRDFINTDSNIGMTMFTTTDGVVVYCMDIDKKPLVQGQSASLVGDADAGVLYILQNGYPKKTYRNNNGMDAYITQMALWWYLSEDKLSSNFKNATGEADKYSLVSATKNLVNAARSAKDNQVKPSMNVNAGDTTFKLSSDQKYYESAYMSASLTGTNTYNVNVTGATKNTVVVDEQGNIGTTMNSNEKFMIKVPAAEVNNTINVTVKFTANGKLQKAKIYKSSDNNYQRVVGLFSDDVNLEKTIDLSLNLEKHVCEVVGDKYYGKNGTIVDKDTYTKDCKHVCEFIDNKYYGKKGNEVDKDTYNKECGHVCEFTDNKYYGKNGKVVDKRTYNIECGHVCEFTDNKYYGKNGTEVDKKTFNKECNKSCEQDNGKYYGKDGTEIDKKTFDKECGHFCEVVDNKYYDNNGNEVDKNTYTKACGQEVIVPNTSANISSLGIIAGMILVVSGAGFIAYRRNMLF